MAETVYNRSVQDVLPSYFLTYAQSVLQDRAIPSGFDGLKPVHRRVLMSYHDLKLFSTSPYQKCAKVCGIALGNYHPHGDQSVYEALVGLAQPFNMRYPLIEGSGNFGDISGKPPAAMRYTQSRLSPYGELMLEDVDTLADMKDNFDNSQKEPIDLPSYFPNLLMNGIPTAIAVGMATKFAPHYAKDIYNAILYVIDCRIKNVLPNIDQIINIIKAPDFPTGAQIVNGSQMRSIYKTGRGPVTLRAKYILENNFIIYTEIPYKTSPNSIVQAIANLNINDIKDVRDESSERTGLRIVVELKKNANSTWIINKLFKETPLQSNFNVNMVAIMNNRPESNLNILQIIGYYLQKLSEVHNRKINLEILDYQDKLFKVNTMLIAIDHIKEIIDYIQDMDIETAKATIAQEIFGLDEDETKAAEYILSLRLNSLSKASKEDLKIKKETYIQELERLNKIIESPENFLTDIANKIKSIRDSKLFKNDKRKTEILDISTQDNSQDILSYVKEEPVIITYSNTGMIRAVRPDEYKTNKRNAMGVKNSSLRKEEYIQDTISLTTHQDLLLFSDFGRCYLLPVYKIPITSRNGASRSINNFINLMDGERIIRVADASLPKEDEEIKNAVFVTKNGFVKRIKLDQLITGRSSTVGSKAITLNDEDELRGASICSDNDDLLIFTSHGRGLKFNIDDPDKPLRPMGKTAKGVSALKLKPDEIVVSASNLTVNESVIIVTSKGYGKKLEAETFKNQKRNQTPINYFSKIDKVGKVIGAVNLKSNEELIVTTSQGQTLRLDVNNIRATGRTSVGVKLINIKEDTDKVVSICSVKKREEENIESGENNGKSE